MQCCVISAKKPQHLLMFLGAQNYTDDRQWQLYHFDLLKDIPNQFKEPKYTYLDTCVSLIKLNYLEH